MYGYEIASSRLKKYAYKIKDFLKDSVSSITIAFMGDLINSDRRIDELLGNDGSVAEALVKAVEILSAFIKDLAIDYDITVVSVLGNESRINRDVPMSDPVNNFDFLIHKFLSELFRFTKVRFMNVDRSYEKLINILGANILLTHGHTKITWDSAVKKYNKLGKILHYMITAHLHSVHIKEQTSQNGSLSGNNFYGFHGINDIVDASQTIYIVEKEVDGLPPTISPVIFNLQRIFGYEGYYFQKDVCKMKQ
jgi:hypothetical protein